MEYGYSASKVIFLTEHKLIVALSVQTKRFVCSSKVEGYACIRGIATSNIFLTGPTSTEEPHELCSTKFCLGIFHPVNFYNFAFLYLPISFVSLCL